MLVVAADMDGERAGAYYGAESPYSDAGGRYGVAREQH